MVCVAGARRRQKLTVSTGMIGQTSGRVMWVVPNTYQSATSLFGIERLDGVHSGRQWSILVSVTNPLAVYPPDASGSRGGIRRPCVS